MILTFSIKIGVRIPNKKTCVSSFGSVTFHNFKMSGILTGILTFLRSLGTTLDVPFYGMPLFGRYVRKWVVEPSLYEGICLAFCCMGWLFVEIT